MVTLTLSKRTGGIFGLLIVGERSPWPSAVQENWRNIRILGQPEQQFSWRQYRRIGKGAEYDTLNKIHDESFPWFIFGWRRKSKEKLIPIESCSTRFYAYTLFCPKKFVWLFWHDIYLHRARRHPCRTSTRTEKRWGRRRPVRRRLRRRSSSERWRRWRRRNSERWRRRMF